MTVPARYRSRKFVAWVVLLVLSTVLLWFGRIGADNWEGVVTWVTIGYAFSNAFQAAWLGKSR